MSFKESLKAEAELFLNPAEFAEELSINDQPPRPGLIMEAKKIYFNESANDFPELELRRKKLFVLAKDLEDCFLADKNIKINGQIWQIERSLYNAGMVEADLVKKEY